MNSRDYKQVFGSCLARCGFVRASKVFTRSHGGVATLMDFQKSNFANKWWMNVGFWLERLGGDRPDKVEKTHMYYRLERLMPEHKEIILAAGDLDDAEQGNAYERLVELFPGQIDRFLRELGTEEGLRAGMKAGKLEGLVRKEAREWLLCNECQ